MDGILVESRFCVKHLLNVMSDFKNSMPLIKHLTNFIIENADSDNIKRDMASHVLAILIEG